MTYDSALFEVNVADGARRITTAKPNGGGGAITKWSIDSAFLTSTDGFEFEFVDTEKENLELAPVELLIDGNSQLHGRVDITRVGDKGPSIVTCMGRDYLADLVEGNCDPAVSIAAGATLEDTILSVCAPYGIIGVDGPEARQAARTKKPQNPVKRPRKKQLQDGKPEPGQGAYDYCNRILARHALTMQPAADPTKVVLQGPNYEQASSGRIIRKSSVDNGEPGCVLSGIATRDFSRMPTFVLMTGRQGPPTQSTTRIVSSVTLGGNWVQEYGSDVPVERKNWVARDAVTSVAKVTTTTLKNAWDMAQVAASYSPELARILNQWSIGGRRLPSNKSAIIPRALYRLLYFRDESAKDQAQIDAASLRAVAERLKDTLVYEVTLRGLVDPSTGYYWNYDTIVDVDDDIARVHESLWVASRRFSFDGKELRTTLQCWRPGSFVIGDPNA